LLVYPQSLLLLSCIVFCCCSGCSSSRGCRECCWAQ
jgi:hypothetical protein